MSSRYHQVRIKEGDIYKTTFWTRYRHYDFVIVPFDLTNSPATFMYLMNIVLHPYLDNFVIVFIDDILVSSKNEEEHVEHLAAVFRFFRENKFYDKLNKCSFFETEMHYSRHAVSKKGIAVDLEKISVIVEWVAPKTVDEVRYFMGLVCY